MSDQVINWQQERNTLNQRIAELSAQGICYTCYDLQTGSLFGDQHVIFEDAEFRVVLESYPRVVGHTIIVYKPHRTDISELSDSETGPLFVLSVRIVNALKQALKAEKVYLVTMCDGDINHLHIQLLPRYAGEAIGSKRLVTPRQPLINGADVAERIRAAL